MGGTIGGAPYEGRGFTGGNKGGGDGMGMGMGMELEIGQPEVVVF